MAVETKNIMYCVIVIALIGLLLANLPSSVSTAYANTRVPITTFRGVELGSFEDSQEIRFNSTDFVTDAGSYLIYPWTITTSAANYYFVALIDDFSIHSQIDWIKIGVRILFLNAWVDTWWCDWINTTGYNYGDNFTFTEMAIEDPANHEIETQFLLTIDEHPEFSSSLFLFGINQGAYGALMCLINGIGIGVHGFGTKTTEQPLTGFAFFMQLLTFQTPTLPIYFNLFAWLFITVPITIVVYQFVRDSLPW